MSDGERLDDTLRRIFILAILAGFGWLAYLFFRTPLWQTRG